MQGERTFAAVRCAIGRTTSDGLELRVRRVRGTEETTIATHLMLQSWHRDGSVSYNIDLASFGNIATKVQHELHQAAAMWNSEKADHFYSVYFGGVVSAVTIVGFSPTHQNACARETVLACVSNSNTGSFPHLGSQLIRVMFPLASGYQWTDDLAMAQMPGTTMIYIRQALAHELGHTIGLGHLPRGHIMGAYYLGEPLTSLQPDETYGFRKVTEDH